MRLSLAVALLLPLAACSPSKPAAPPAAQAKYNTNLPMAELMAHVINPASFLYWNGSGTEITEKGERDLSPTTEAGWETLENGAAILIESGNLLQMPGRAQAPVADWNRYAQDLTNRAIIAKAAAEKHDKEAVFQEGGRVYEVCVACHKQYVIDPGIKASPPPSVTLPDIPPDFVKKK